MTQSPSVPRHQLHLRDNLTPAMKAATYTIKVDQSVDGARGGKKHLPEATQTVVVDAPRFTLDPASVLGVYPPPDTAGDYRGALPHVTVKQASLPWARTVEGFEDTSRVPWLAVLVVTEDDLLKDALRGELSPVRQVAEVKGTSGQKGPVLLPVLDGVPEAVAETSCRTIDVKRDALGELLPRRHELPFLAHVRDVEIVRVAGESTLQSVERGLRKGRFGVVLGNRFPRSQKVQYTAHLVSLEGHGNYDFLKGPTPTGECKAVRFVSLWSWSFACTENPSDFRALAKGLLGSARKEPVLRLPASPSTPNDPVGERVRQRRTHGYVSTAFRLPSGEDTICWYRGPFTALPPQDPRAGAPAFRSAAASLVYVKEDAVFDVGYASAFEAGRLLALANIDLAATMGRVRGKAMTALQDLVAAAGAAGAPCDIAPPTTGPAVTRFNDLIKNHHVGARITDGLKRASTVTDTPSGEPDEPQDTDEGWATALSAFLDDSEGDGERDGTATPVSPGAAAARAACATVLSDTAEASAADLAEAGLDRAKLLNAVPFHFLVPDARMLPPESLRLFHVDPYWLDALYAGAASLGIATSLDRRFTAHLLNTTRDGKPVPKLGMLVRSALVKDWPDLTYQASCKPPDPGLKVLARRPASDILLLLFTGIPHEVVLSEPPQALSFGLDSPSGNGTLDLRRITDGGSGKGIGTPAGALTGVYALTRAVAKNSGTTFPRAAEVLNIDDRSHLPPSGKTLVQALEEQLRTTAGALGPSAKLTPATLGSQLFNSARLLRIQPAIGGRNG
ncbi:hypothetical protein AB0H73_10905 [Streptomyces olivoreticuli]